MCISSWNHFQVKTEVSKDSYNVKQSTLKIPICAFLIHLVKKIRNVWTYLVQLKSAGLVLAISEIQKYLNLTSGLFQCISSLFLVAFPVSNFLENCIFINRYDIKWRFK